MTKNSINAKCEALELHGLSSEELDAVSGGDQSNDAAKSNAAENAAKQHEDAHQASAMRLFRLLVQEHQF